MKDRDTIPGDIHDAPGATGAPAAFGVGRAPSGVPHEPAGASRAASMVLSDFGRRIGLPGLHFGDDDCCWLTIGGEHIACVATQGDHGFLRLHGEVAELPPERDAPDIAPWFRRLLAMNADTLRRGEFPFAIDPRRNALVLTANVPLTATGAQVQDAMEDLIDQLIACKRNPPAADGGPEGDGEDFGGGNFDAGDFGGSAGAHGRQEQPAGVGAVPRQAAHRRAVIRPTAPPPAVAGELVWRV